jgi:uncharacterized repeat protein (TIGR03803 family)
MKVSHFSLGKPWPKIICTAILLLLASILAAAQETVLYRFQSGNDGSEPRAGLIADAAGNLYGTTFYGGSRASVGTIFRLTPPRRLGAAWSETVLHTFSDLLGGWDPWAGLIFDKAGNLYGTTWLGGTSGDCGVVFELSPSGGSWTYTVIHNFACGGVSDGGESRADLVMDQSGNLFGTTSVGGSGSCVGGCGVVFELSPSNGGWTETVLYNFQGASEQVGGTGGGVVLDKQGNLYGTNYRGNVRNAAGAVFELKRPPKNGGSWRYKVIHNFTDPTDGAFPSAGVVFDAHGNLYGTTEFGAGSGCGGSGCGVVFELNPSSTGTWAYAVLYRFAGNGDGGLPQASLTPGAAGDLYGTTQEGGTGLGCSGLGCGVAFRLRPPHGPGGAWTETVLHTFHGGRDGYVPWGQPAFGKGGRLYGTTQFGGIPTCEIDNFGCGTVFEIIP